jgi:type II secretory pathway pseudopilin PulG
MARASVRANVPQRGETSDVRRSTHKPGISLLEVVLVLAVMGVLAAIAVPRYASAAMRHELDAEASRLSADLDFARRSAVSTSRPWRVIISQDGGTYIVEAVPYDEIEASSDPVATEVSPTLISAVTGTLTNLLSGRDAEDDGGSLPLARETFALISGDEIEDADVTAESSLSAAALGTTKLEPRILTSATIADLDVIATADPVTRTVIFDAHGRPNRAFRLSIDMGAGTRTVSVSPGGVVSWQ